MSRPKSRVLKSSFLCNLRISLSNDNCGLAQIKKGKEVKEAVQDKEVESEANENFELIFNQKCEVSLEKAKLTIKNKGTLLYEYDLFEDCVFFEALALNSSEYFVLTDSKAEVSFHPQTAKDLCRWEKALRSQCVVVEEFRPYYKKIEALGKGGYATVFKVMRRIDGAEFVVKEFKKENPKRTPESILKYFTNEVKLLKYVKGTRNVPQYVEAYATETTFGIITSCFNGQTLGSLIQAKDRENRLKHQEMAKRLRKRKLLEALEGGDAEESSNTNSQEDGDTSSPKVALSDKTKEEKLDIDEEIPYQKDGLGEQFTKKCAQQLMQILYMLEHMNVIHNDIKPDNLIFSSDTSPILNAIDFGTAKIEPYHNVNPPKDVPKAKKVCGTLGYIAPEVLSGYPANYRSDVFSVGSVVCSLLFGEPAFRAHESVDLYTVNKKVILNWDDPKFSRASPEAVDFLQKVLTRKPQDRMTALEALNHPWLRVKSDSHEALDGILDEESDIPCEQEGHASAKKRSNHRANTVASKVSKNLRPFYFNKPQPAITKVVNGIHQMSYTGKVLLQVIKSVLWS